MNYEQKNLSQNLTKQLLHKCISTRLVIKASLVLFLCALSLLHASSISNQNPELNKASYAYLEQELCPRPQEPSRIKMIVRHAVYAAAASLSGVVAALACNVVAPAVSPAYQKSVAKKVQAQKLEDLLKIQQKLERVMGDLSFGLEDLAGDVCHLNKKTQSRISVPQRGHGGTIKNLERVAEQSARTHNMLVVLTSFAFSVATYGLLAYLFKPEPWSFRSIWKQFIAHWPEHRPFVPEEFWEMCDSWHQRSKSMMGVTLGEQEAQVLVETIILRCMEVRLGG